jgi:hypothetical protein
LVTAGAREGQGDEEEDTVLVTKFGEEVIGALVVRFEALGSPDSGSGSSNGSGGKSRAAPRRNTRKSRGTSSPTPAGSGSSSSSSSSGGGGGGGSPKALFRAWAVRLRYRHKGVGGNLLLEGVRLARRKLGPAAVIEFAQDHASKFLLHNHTLFFGFSTVLCYHCPHPTPSVRTPPLLPK